MHRICLAEGGQGRARRAAQCDQESGRVVAVHFDRLVELRIEAEADEHRAVPVNLELRTLAKLFEPSAASGGSPRAVASWSTSSSVGSSMSSQNGSPAATS